MIFISLRGIDKQEVEGGNTRNKRAGCNGKNRK